MILILPKEIISADTCLPGRWKKSKVFPHPVDCSEHHSWRGNNSDQTLVNQFFNRKMNIVEALSAPLQQQNHTHAPESLGRKVHEWSMERRWYGVEIVLARRLTWRSMIAVPGWACWSKRWWLPKYWDCSPDTSATGTTVKHLDYFSMYFYRIANNIPSEDRTALVQIPDQIQVL